MSLMRDMLRDGNHPAWWAVAVCIAVLVSVLVAFLLR
jgi:hypothetical protein